LLDSKRDGKCGRNNDGGRTLESARGAVCENERGRYRIAKRRNKHHRCRHARLRRAHDPRHGAPVAEIRRRAVPAVGCTAGMFLARGGGCAGVPAVAFRNARARHACVGRRARALRAPRRAHKDSHPNEVQADHRDRSHGPDEPVPGTVFVSARSDGVHQAKSVGSRQ
jgi:hypothetical protein